MPHAAIATYFVKSLLRRSGRWGPIGCTALGCTALLPNLVDGAPQDSDGSFKSAAAVRGPVPPVVQTVVDVFKQFATAVAEESLRTLDLPTAADVQEEYRKKAAVQAQIEQRKRPAADAQDEYYKRPAADMSGRPAKRSPHPPPFMRPSPDAATPLEPLPTSPPPRRRGPPQHPGYPHPQGTGPAQSEEAPPGPSRTPDAPVQATRARSGVRSTERRRASAPGRYRDDSTEDVAHPPPRRAQAISAEVPAQRVERAAGLGSPREAPGRAHAQTPRRRDAGGRYPSSPQEPATAAVPVHAGAFSQRYSSAMALSGAPPAPALQKMSPAKAVHAALSAGQPGVPAGPGPVTQGAARLPAASLGTVPLGPVATGANVQQPGGGGAYPLGTVPAVPQGPQPSLPVTQVPMSVGGPTSMAAPRLAVNVGGPGTLAVPPQSAREGALPPSGMLSPTGMLSPSGTPKMSDQAAAQVRSMSRPPLTPTRLCFRELRCGMDAFQGRAWQEQNKATGRVSRNRILVTDCLSRKALQEQKTDPGCPVLIVHVTPGSGNRF